MLALEFPPVSHLIEWPTIFGDGPFAVNKVVLLMWLAVLLVGGLFIIASRRRSLVPTGVQNFGEIVVEFIEDQIVLQTMGHDGLRYTPFLMTLFSFVFVCNIFGIIPLLQMPVNARMALPAFMAIVVWLVYWIVGIARQGPLGYLKNSTIPPGVPKAMLPLVMLIEFLQIAILRPFSLAVRLFANLLAGHLLLVSFAVIATALFEATVIGSVAPAAMLIALTGFELLVAFLQAYIFTILTAVYIGSSMAAEH